MTLKNIQNKKAQITLFILIAIVIVFAIAIFFAVKTDLFAKITGGEAINPSTFMESCLEDSMRQNINTATLQGGFLNPKLLKYHDDIKATYLCYNRGYFDHCINQHPMLLSEIEAELKTAIQPVVEDCFIQLEENFQKAGGEMELGNAVDTIVDLYSGYVQVNLVREITITQKGETSIINESKIRYPTSLYELASIATEIVFNEAKYFGFENKGLMNIFTDYLVILSTMSDQTKIYTISSKKTQEKMKIAIRGCALA